MKARNDKSQQPTASVAVVVEPISLDIRHAAAFIDTTVRQIRSLIYARELVPVRVGKKDLLLVADLRAFIEKRRQAA